MTIKHYKNICVNCKAFDDFLVKIIRQTDGIPTITMGICKNIKSDHNGHIISTTHSSCKEMEK